MRVRAEASHRPMSLLPQGSHGDVRGSHPFEGRVALAAVVVFVHDHGAHEPLGRRRLAEGPPGPLLCITNVVSSTAASIRNTLAMPSSSAAASSAGPAAMSSSAVLVPSPHPPARAHPCTNRATCTGAWPGLAAETPTRRGAAAPARRATAPSSGARSRGEGAVGPAHLLVALAQQPDSHAADQLAEAGFDAGRLRQLLL